MFTKWPTGLAFRTEETQQRSECWADGQSPQSMEVGPCLRQCVLEAMRVQWKGHMPHGTCEIPPGGAPDRAAPSSTHPSHCVVWGVAVPSGLCLLICGLDELQGPCPSCWVSHTGGNPVPLYTSGHAEIVPDTFFAFSVLVDRKSRGETSHASSDSQPTLPGTGQAGSG